MFGRKEKSVGQKINEARYNPENPDYRAVNVSDKLMELHEKFCEARGLDPDATPVSETVEAIAFIDRQERQNPPRNFR